jgi:hypothetical protein
LAIVSTPKVGPLTIEENGDIESVWFQDWVDDRALVGNRYLVGKGWQTVTAVKGALPDVDSLRVIHRPDQTLLVSWLIYSDPEEGNEQSIWVANFDLDKGFGDITQIYKEVPKEGYNDLTVGVDTDGNAIALWTGYGDSDGNGSLDRQDIWASQFK